LPDIRFHDLRHTCATVLLSQGVNPKFVQELLGHADIKLTLGTYSHFLPSMGDQTAAAMESSLGLSGCSTVAVIRPRRYAEAYSLYYRFTCKLSKK